MIPSTAINFFFLNPELDSIRTPTDPNHSFFSSKDMQSINYHDLCSNDENQQPGKFHGILHRYNKFHARTYFFYERAQSFCSLKEHPNQDTPRMKLKLLDPGGLS